VGVHYVKTNVLGTKGPFSAKAGRWFWLFIFSHLQRSPRKLLTLKEVENVIYGDIMYYPSKSISRNIFFGEIPLSISKCSALKYLDMAYNRINGSIPIELADLNSLSVMRLGDNLLGGTIPTELGSIEWLAVLDLHNLTLFGEIPFEISNCKLLLQL